MCGCLVFIELRNRCLFQKCGEEGHQTVAPQVTGYNLAVFDKYGGRDGADPIESGAFTVPTFQVGHLRPGQFELVDGFLPGFGIVIQ